MATSTASQPAPMGPFQQAPTSQQPQDYAGPVPPGANESVFRQTGSTVGTTSGPGSYGSPLSPGTSYGGGYGSGHGGSSTPNTSTALGGQLPPAPEPTNIAVTISASGAVGLGGQTYYGNAQVPGMGGLTANQISQQARLDAINSGEISPSDYGRVSFKGNIPIAHEVTPQTDYLNVKSTHVSTPTTIERGPLLYYYTDPNTGAQTPVYGRATVSENIFPVTESGHTILGLEATRNATDAEARYFKESEAALALSTGTASTEPYNPRAAVLGRTVQAVKDDYYQLNQALKEMVTYPIRDIATEVAAEFNTTPTEILSRANYGEFGNKQMADFITGFEKGIAQDIIENPLKQAATFGVGAGLGVLYKGGTAALSQLPNLGIRLSELAPTAFQGAALGAGAYSVLSTGGSIIAAASASENPERAGETVGVGAKDLALVGLGFGAGEKGYNILRGLYESRGRAEIDIPQGIYPTAPVSKQLELFQKNIYEDISQKPIGFHTTPDIFYDAGVITPSKGASELPGLYVSTQVSTPFSKIQGSGSSAPSSFQQAVKAFFENIGKEKKPGVASLEPLGFRNVKVGYSSKPTFEGQVPVGSKYAYFKPSAKSGIMDLPGIKSEIEAIAREGAGSYKEIATATGKKYYVNIAGVRVPLDTFKINMDSMGKSIRNDLVKVGDEIRADIQRRFHPEDYTTKSLRSSPATKLSSVSALSISKEMDEISRSITQQMSSSASQVSSQSSALSSSSAVSSGSSRSSGSSAKSGSSSAPSSSSAISSAVYGSSGSSSGASISQQYNSLMSGIVSPPIRQVSKKTRNLGAGWDVYGKVVKTSRFEKLNQQPLSRSRAKDVAQYYLDNSLARTTKLRKTSQAAQEDIQFLFIPAGYYAQRGYTSREYRIKNKKSVVLDDEIIKKSMYLSDTQAEKEQLNFYKQMQKDLKRNGF